MKLFALSTLTIIALSAISTHAIEQITEHTFKLGEADPAPAVIEQMGWLQGYWVGSGLGGTCEENWGIPQGDRMHGYFSLRQEGEAVFSEALLLVEEAGSVVMKVKHFHPNFAGWEEKDDYITFRLVKLESGAAYFNGLTFIRGENDDLLIYLVLTDEGKKTEHTFTMALYQPN